MIKIPLNRVLGKTEICCSEKIHLKNFNFHSSCSFDDSFSTPSYLNFQSFWKNLEEKSIGLTQLSQFSIFLEKFGRKVYWPTFGNSKFLSLS